jgi:hypothetical protein
MRDAARRLLSAHVMRTATALVAAALGACGGRAEPTPPSAPPPAYTASFASTPASDGGDAATLTAQCLPRSLPVAANGAPTCIVVLARFPTGTGAAADVDACRTCDLPGLATLPDSFAATSIDARLAQYGCICLVDQGPACAASSLPATPFQWCVSDGAAATALGCAYPDAIELSANVTVGASVFVACYPPGTAVP